MTTDATAAATDAGTTTADSGEVQTPDELIKQREINQRLQGKLTDIEKKYAQAASILKDIDVDEYKAMKGRLEEAERKAAETDPKKFEELMNRKLSKFQSEAQEKEQTYTKKINELLAENKTLKVTDKVMAEIGTLFQPDTLKFIKREVEQLCDLDEDGTIVVKDENGAPMYRSGKVVGIKELGELLIEQYPSMAKSQAMGGSKDATQGNKTRSLGASGKLPESWAELSALPNAKEVLNKIARDEPALYKKICSTMPR